MKSLHLYNIKEIKHEKLIAGSNVFWKNKPTISLLKAFTEQALFPCAI